LNPRPIPCKGIALPTELSLYQALEQVQLVKSRWKTWFRKIARRGQAFSRRLPF
jgi:hypothetical protein